MGRSKILRLQDLPALLEPFDRLSFVREQPQVHIAILRDILDELHVLFVFGMD